MGRLTFSLVLRWMHSFMYNVEIVYWISAPLEMLFKQDNLYWFNKKKKQHSTKHDLRVSKNKKNLVFIQLYNTICFVIFKSIQNANYFLTYDTRSQLIRTRTALGRTVHAHFEISTAHAQFVRGQCQCIKKVNYTIKKLLNQIFIIS